MKQFLFIAFSALLLSACASFDDDLFTKHSNLETFGISNLNGTYFNTALHYEQVRKDGKDPDVDSLYCLWDHFNYKKYDYEQANQLKIELEVLSPKKLELRLMNKDSLLDKEKVRGKFENGYFYEKSRFFFLPIIPFVYGHANYRIRLKCDSKNNLVYEGIYRGHFITILGGTKSNLQTQSVHLRE